MPRVYVCPHIHTATNTYTVKNSTRDGDSPSGWFLHHSRTLVWYKEHSSAWYFQQNSPDTSLTWRKRTETPRGCAGISDFLMSCNSGTAQWKTSFQSHIVEQHKSYRMVVESWESVQANLNVPLFASACKQHAQNRSPRSSWTSLGYGTWTRRK